MGTGSYFVIVGNFRLGTDCRRVFEKGALRVYIEGPPCVRVNGRDKEGAGDRYTTEIQADEMQMLDSRSASSGWTPYDGANVKQKSTLKGPPSGPL